MSRILPAWADELRRRYLRGESSIFVLHGNVYDAVVHDGEVVTLTEFLGKVLLEQSKQTIARYGLEKPSRIGYSIGVNYTPNWADHTASLRSGDKTVLEPNMTFHLMLGMWMDGWGYEASETFRVTERGHELFADFPQQLFVKE